MLEEIVLGCLGTILTLVITWLLWFITLIIGECVLDVLGKDGSDNQFMCLVFGILLYALIGIIIYSFHMIGTFIKMVL